MTLRAIAADAGVDPALPNYFFGSKQALFGAAMALAVNPMDAMADVLSGPLDDLAERLLRRLLATWDDPVSGPQLRTVAAAAATDANRARLIRETVARELMTRLTERLDTPHAHDRAAAFGSQVIGVIFSRYILRLEPIASLEPERVVELLAPALQLTLDRPEPSIPHGPVGPVR